MADEELEQAYSAQLKRKDAEISELKKKNDLLMKTALKQSDKVRELSEIIRKMEKSCK